MSIESVKEEIKRELPAILRADPEFRAYILELTRQSYADRAETQDRFRELMEEMKRDREEQTRKWEANQAELQRMREEQAAKWAEQNRKWEANQAELRAMREEQNRKWEANQAELRAMREEQKLVWAENQAELKRLHDEYMAYVKKFDRSIGALGARCGLNSEKAFRDALAGILEESFGVEVLHVNEFDDSGEVFGRPEQVELDLIIRNGLLMICELKSSIDKAGMYSFERKARYYERRHQRQATRLIVISPMVDARAQKVAEQLGIETFGDSSEVGAL